MHSLFTVAGDVVRLVPTRPFADHYTEKRMQDWSDLNPAVINGGQPMISLGTEIRTPHGHYIDNLFIDGDGVLVAAEVKRGRSRRDVVSQMLDYAAFISRLTWNEIELLCKKRQGAALTDLYAQTFGRSLRKGNKPDHRLAIVAESFEESTLDQALYLINDRSTPLVLIAFKFLEINGQSLIYVEPVLGVIPAQGQVTATSEVRPDDGYAAWLLPAIGEKLGEISEAQGWQLRYSVNKQSVTFNSAEWPVALGDCQFRIDLYRRAAVSCRFFCRLSETSGLKEVLEAQRTSWWKFISGERTTPDRCAPLSHSHARSDAP